ncbi:unnamed protein product [Rotaria sp. Silwood1]|nr:unnamed protein product [Rotaria sp. Silwood1]
MKTILFLFLSRKNTASHTAKSAKKTAEHVAAKAASEKIKQQASDAGEKIKTTVEETKKQVEKQNDGFVDKFFNFVTDVKNSILEPVGLASNVADDVIDQAASKLDEVSDKAKKVAGKAKKKVKETVEL